MSDVDEPISICDHDPSWPAHCEQEQQRVRDVLGPIVLATEHFGSSAVPGLVSKPIIDILVGVRDLAEAKLRAPALAELGYEDFGEIFVPGRLYLRKRGALPHFNVAITELGSPFWTTNLIVRDYLRVHPHEVTEYAWHKREAVQQGATMFSSYSQAKEPFLSALRQRAERWSRAARRDLTPGDAS
jgi:GrpB-like predicted nucleotidyltransferase (UPF0157 family)